MKKILLLIFSIFIVSNYAVAQVNFGKPYVVYSKHQKKVLKKFSSGKRHKRYIPYKHRSNVYNPTVKKGTKRMLKSRYRNKE